MAQYTPNYGLEMPEATDDFKDFRASYNSNMGIIDNNMGGGGGSGGHTIYDEAGNALPQESGMQFTGAVTVSDDSGNGRTVVNIESGGGSTFGFAIDENNKLFEGTINDFNQSLSYTATEDAIALCYFRGGVGTWQFLSINGVYIRLYGDGTNQAVSYSVPIRKGDVVASRSESYSESCYFLLSVYGIKQGTNGIFAPVIYSDTERKIGIWRDNKPLYAKTVNFGALPNNDVKDVSHGIADIDKVWIAGGFAYQPNGDFSNQLSLNVPNSSASGWYFGATTSLVRCQTGSDRTNYSAFVTLYYTKTTDTPGSGAWTTSGAAAVHYSTNEQVIGTWISGKPLYQKTWRFNSTVIINANTWTSLGINEPTFEIKSRETLDDEDRPNTTLYCTVRNGYVSAFSDVAINVQTITLRYTKTTD